MKKIFNLSMIVLLLMFFAVQSSYSQASTAPNFVEKDMNGNDFNLSSLKGNYVLIDFWASWCAPCRVDIKEYIKPLWEQYKNEDFAIVGVSLDRSKGAWLGYIKQHNLDWIHVSDLQHWNSAVAKLYGVGYIPQNVLIDKNGKIIAKNLRGYKLAVKLKELFEGTASVQ